MFTCLVLFKIWHVLCHHCRCIESSLESTPWFFPSASPVTSRLTFSFTCQLISIIITTLIIHHSFTVSLQAQNLPFQQMLPTLDFFYLPDCLHDNGTGPGLSCSSFYFQFHIFIGHRRCAYYIFRRWGFIYLFLFFFQSPSRLDLTSDCHNQCQYRKIVEVAVIWNMTRLKILPMWGVSPQNVPKIEQKNDPQDGKTARIQILSNLSEN